MRAKGDGPSPRPGNGGPGGMRHDRPETDGAPTLEDELEEAAELLAQQEPPEALRPDPSTPTGYGDPALIDPAD